MNNNIQKTTIKPSPSILKENFSIKQANAFSPITIHDSETSFKLMQIYDGFHTIENQKILAKMICNTPNALMRAEELVKYLDEEFGLNPENDPMLKHMVEAINRCR